MDMNGTKSMVFSVSGCILLAGSIVFGRQQDRELAGIHGLPVEGHDTVASVEIVGTKQIHLHKIHERLRSNGADVRLGLPLESPTLCRFKEVLRDVMAERFSRRGNHIRRAANLRKSTRPGTQVHNH